jgi:hypothetical protein
MKNIFMFALTIMLASSAAFADEPPMDSDAPITCPEKVEDVAKMIISLSTCYDASRAANQCALGSSADVQIAGAAKLVCLKEAGNLSNSDQALLTEMTKRCVEAYQGKQGTMFMSMAAFCELKAAEFINSVQSNPL